MKYLFLPLLFLISCRCPEIITSTSSTRSSDTSYVHRDSLITIRYQDSLRFVAHYDSIIDNLLSFANEAQEVRTTIDNDTIFIPLTRTIFKQKQGSAEATISLLKDSLGKMHFLLDINIDSLLQANVDLKDRYIHTIDSINFLAVVQECPHWPKVFKGEVPHDVILVVFVFFLIVIVVWALKKWR